MNNILPVALITSQLIPQLGQISAGIPIDAVEDNTQQDLLELLTSPGRYALKVCGDSMIDAGIFNDDIIIVQSLQQARSGDIVVALIDNETVTLKRIRYLPDGRIILMADNAEVENLVYDAERITIQGKVVGQIRNYL